MSEKSEIVLFRTHKFDEFVKVNWKQLKKQTSNHCILYDATGKDILGRKNSYNFTLEDYKKSGYPLASKGQIHTLPAYKKVNSQQSLVNSQQSTVNKLTTNDCRLMTNWEIYFNPEYAILLYFREHPDYDFYWSIEYDVFFNGNWNYLFDSCKNDESDLLCCYLRNFADEIPYNELWDNLSFEPKHHKICFGPVMRFSNEALAVLDAEYSSGKHGFWETAIPTILSDNNLLCTDINRLGNFYSPLTFGADYIKQSWTHENFNKYKNFMYHPFRKS